MNKPLLREHDVIVFQHPFTPIVVRALLKEWLDRVLSRGSPATVGKLTAGKYWRKRDYDWRAGERLLV